MQKRLLVEILTPEIVSVSPGAPIVEAAEIMKKNNFSCIPVLEGKKAVGIVTERSIVSYIAHEKMGHNGRPVQDLMSKPVLTANQKMNILQGAAFYFTVPKVS
ncbi:MAG: CBS domain-containing protein [Desulfobulbaceae bacterium]|nr:CBS domain-containing protein [Desulfobulbaceae bacterium]